MKRLSSVAFALAVALVAAPTLTGCAVELDSGEQPATGVVVDDDALTDAEEEARLIDEENAAGHDDGEFVDDSSDDVYDENNPPVVDPDAEEPIDEADIEDAVTVACPAGVTCVEDVPFNAASTTVGGADRFNRYNCSTSNESGPERVYRVELPGPGTISVTLNGSLEANGTDVDVHILSSLSANACLARGDRTASAAVSADFVYVAFDSFQRSNGTNGAGRFAGLISFTPVPVAEDNPLIAAGVPAAVAELAMLAWNSAEEQDLTDSPIFTIIDFSKPSTSKRLWTVDTETGELLASHRVTHGIGSSGSSNKALATSFSNVNGSSKSSLGLSRTAETYSGKHGYSLRLDGLESSNSRMRSRAIVVHGADYAEDSFSSSNGYLGRSNGCPAIAQSRSRAFINIIKGGTLIFSYYPSNAWINSSPFLN